MSEFHIPYHENGKLIPFGRVEKHREWNSLDDTTLPAGLATSAGTLSYQTMATGAGGVTLTAATSASANISLATTINLAAIEAVRFELMSVRSVDATSATNTNTWTIALNATQTGGFILLQPAAPSNMKITQASSVGQQDVNYATDYINRRNIGLILLVRQKMLLLMEDDQCHDARSWPGTNPTTGLSDATFLMGTTATPVAATFTVSAKSSGASSVSISKIRITTWSN